MQSSAPVVLTDEEQRECQAMLRSMTQIDGKQCAIREDLADSLQRSIVAQCMISRAERFLILANSQPKYKEQACQAAAKACAIFPLSIYFYDFGCILQQVGKSQEAKEMFTEFLRRLGTETLDPVMQSTLEQRDVEQAALHAGAVT